MVLLIVWVVVIGFGGTNTSTGKEIHFFDQRPALYHGILTRAIGATGIAVAEKVAGA
jgi:hypothetical protein